MIHAKHATGRQGDFMRQPFVKISEKLHNRFEGHSQTPSVITWMSFLFSDNFFPVHVIITTKSNELAHSIVMSESLKVLPFDLTNYLHRVEEDGSHRTLAIVRLFGFFTCSKRSLQIQRLNARVTTKCPQS